MKYKSPQQQIFDVVFKTSRKLGYDTFDYLPPSHQELPFVFVGEQFDQDRHTKRFLYGDVQQTIHIYHDHKKRREATDMMNSLKYELRKLKNTKNFFIRCKQINSQTLIDNSTSETLIHGILEVEFTFY